MGKVGSKISRVVSKIPLLNDDSSDEENDLKIVTRAEWNARVTKWREDLVYPALSVSTVYTDTTPCSTPEECTRAVQDIQATHMDQDGLPDIEYSFLVGGDGRIYEGRGWYTMSNRSTLIKCKDPEFPPPPVILNKDTLKYSPERKIVIACIGNEKESKDNILMMNTVRDLINYGVDNFLIYTGDEDNAINADDYIKGAEARKRKEEEEETEDSD